MRLTFLGTGTSSGVPLIGCGCAVSSADPHNKRRRTSLYVEAAGRCLVMDTPPDFREQALENRVLRVDAVLFTHAHADHIFGFDDIRRFNTIQNCVIPAYGLPDTIDRIRQVFHYIHEEDEPGLYRPRIEFRKITGPFNVGDVAAEPLHVLHDAHGKPTIGYLLRAGGRSLGYVPDCSEMPDSTVEALRGVDVMILDALHMKPHRTHLSLGQSLQLLGRIGAKQSFIVHMGHGLDHQATQDALPAGVFVPYDGLTVEW